MPGTWRCHGAGGAELARRGVVDLDGCEAATEARLAASAGYQHAAIGQRDRGMKDTRALHIAGRAELARCRVVQFRRCEPHLRSVVAAGDEDLAVWQQSRGLAEQTLSHGPR